MKVGYLGPRGSYSYQAACMYAKKNSLSVVEHIALPHFAALFAGVEQGYLDSAIIPIENSTHGAVANALDMMLNLAESTICGEVILNIEHCLLSISGKMEDIKYVCSHEQALEQCHDFFYKRYPDIELIHCSSTSQACELANKNGIAYAAVASKAAAKMYHLSVIMQGIQDNTCNQTRFLVIGGERTTPTGQDKTSIIFAFPGDCPGNLYKVLQSFACRNINLTRVESRPAKDIMGKYVFHMDFNGHRQDLCCASALEEIREQVCWLKILGSYPIDSQENDDGQGKCKCCVI